MNTINIWLISVTGFIIVCSIIILVLKVLTSPDFNKQKRQEEIEEYYKEQEKIDYVE